MESPNLEFEYGDTDTLVAELSGTHFDNSVFEKVGLGRHIWPTSSSDSSISLQMLIHPIKMNVQIKQPWRAKLGCPSFFLFFIKTFSTNDRAGFTSHVPCVADERYDSRKPVPQWSGSPVTASIRVRLPCERNLFPAVDAHVFSFPELYSYTEEPEFALNRDYFEEDFRSHGTVCVCVCV